MPRSSSILPNFRRDGRSFNVAVMASESVAASGEQFKTSCYITYTYIYIYTHTHIYIYRLHEGRAQFTSINHQIGAFEFARRSRISDHTTRLSHDPRPGGHLDKQADFLRAQLLTSLVGGRTRWIQIQCTNVLKQPSFLKFYHFTLWSLCPTYKNVVLVLEQYLLLLLLVHLPVGTFSNGFGSNPQKTADTSSHNTCPSCPACHHKRFSPTQYCADRPFPKVLRWTTRWFLLGELGQKSRINQQNSRWNWRSKSIICGCLLVPRPPAAILATLMG